MNTLHASRAFGRPLRQAAAVAGAGFLLVACVTINVYFPAAAAEAAADRIIDDVWSGAPATNGGEEAPPTDGANDAGASLSPAAAGVSAALVALMDAVLPPAHAQDSPDLEVSSPEIRRITASMRDRHAQLVPHYASGAVGLTADGDVAVRDANAIPLPERARVQGLVKAENADRAALYREVAVANGQPQWEAQIREVFAQRWIARASKGWWYQKPDGSWTRK